VSSPTSDYGFNGESEALAYVPQDYANRRWVNAQLLTLSANPVPTPFIRTSIAATSAFGLESNVHYRFFAKAQYKFLVRDGRLLTPPVAVLSNVALMGETPSGCGLSPYFFDFNGIPHGDSGKTFVAASGDSFYFLVKARASEQDQQGYANLNGRLLPWAFVKLRFGVNDDELQTRFSLGSSEWHGIAGWGGSDDGRDFSPVPTIFIYKKVGPDFELLTRLDGDLQKFLRISPPLPFPPYPYVIPVP